MSGEKRETTRNWPKKIGRQRLKHTESPLLFYSNLHKLMSRWNGETPHCWSPRRDVWSYKQGSGCTRHWPPPITANANVCTEDDWWSELMCKRKKKKHCYAFIVNSIQHILKQLLLSLCFFLWFFRRKQPASLLHCTCLSYGFISILTKGQLLICLANQVNQTPANKLAVADVELISFVEFPCSVIAGQIAIEQAGRMSSGRGFTFSRKQSLCG